jgi:hypothetical protein
MSSRRARTVYRVLPGPQNNVIEEMALIGVQERKFVQVAVQSVGANCIFLHSEAPTPVHNEERHYRSMKPRGVGRFG